MPDPGILYYNRDAGGTLIDPPPVWQHAPASVNYVTDPTTPVTQTVTGIPAGDVTVWIEGTGSVALTGDSTGTVTEGSPASYTGTGADLICTITGSVTFMQVEPLAFPTNPITESQGSRFACRMQHPYSAQVFNQAEGMLIVKHTLPFSRAECAAAFGGSFAAIYPNAFSIGEFNNTSGNYRSVSSNSTADLTEDWSAGNTNTFAVRWSAAANEHQIGVSVNGGAWAWSPITTYTSFLEDTLVMICFDFALTLTTEEFDIYDSDEGTAWIEANA